MEIKKAEQPTTASPKTDEAAKTATNLVNFVGEVKAEFKRITWSNPEELRVYTKIVVAATFFLGMGIYFMDVLIQSSLNLLNWLFRLIA
jgi:preprotein translocase SecE subunit